MTNQKLQSGGEGGFVASAAERNKMGGNPSKLTKQEVDTYKQLTYLTEKDIMACYKR